jgi:hypothetical protein
MALAEFVQQIEKLLPPSLSDERGQLRLVLFGEILDLGQGLFAVFRQIK